MKKIDWKFSEELVDYDRALDFMNQRVEQIINHKANSLIWVLEHPQIYTAGISAKSEDIIDIEKQKIYYTNRGGKYTYHAPGMKIIYVMLDLKELFAPEKPDVARFINFLENWIIDVLKHYQVAGNIRKDRVGIWVETLKGDLLSDKKISAIGIKLKKWVSYHGIALNVNCDLDGFKRIIPCGIKNFGVTSLQDLKVEIKENFSEIFYQNLQNEFQKNITKLAK